MRTLVSASIETCKGRISCQVFYYENGTKIMSTSNGLALDFFT